MLFEQLLDFSEIILIDIITINFLVIISYLKNKYKIIELK